MKIRRALAIALATALGALTAGAATHPSAVHSAAEGVSRASIRTEQALERLVRPEHPAVLRSDATLLSSRLIDAARVHATPVANREIDLPAMTVIGDVQHFVPEHPKPDPEKLGPSAAERTCANQWRALDEGPVQRRVRPLCPSELLPGAPIAASAVEHPAEESQELLRLEVPHAFSSDHLVDLEAPVSGLDPAAPRSLPPASAAPAAKNE